MKSLESVPALALLTALAACGGESSMASASADLIVEVDIQEGTPEALGMVKVANTLDAAALKSKVGLSAKASANVANHRAGQDLQLGTSDDDPFDTLDELDRVPEVGPKSLRKLYAYAKDNGYMTAEDVEPSADAAAPNSSGFMLAMGGSEPKWPEIQALKYGAAKVYRQSRSCDAFSCEAWSDWKVDESEISGNDVKLEVDHTLNMQPYFYIEDEEGTCNSAYLQFDPWLIPLDDSGSAKATARYRQQCSDADYVWDYALSKNPNYTIKHGSTDLVIMQDEPEAPVKARFALVFSW